MDEHEATTRTEPQEEGEALFEEVQEPPWPFVALGLGGSAVSGLVAGRLLGLVPGLGAATMVAGGAGILMRQFLVPLTTRVLADEIRVRFGRKTRFRVPLKNVVEVFPRTYRPVPEYGGWGIRQGPGGRAFNMRGTEGVQLVLRSGQRLLIGSQQPAALAAAIRSALDALQAAPPPPVPADEPAREPPPGAGAAAPPDPPLTGVDDEEPA
jgi:hypothetical protein